MVAPRTMLLALILPVISEAFEDCREGECSAARSTAMLQHRVVGEKLTFCSASFVDAGCYELTGKKELKVVTPMQLAESFNTNLNSSEHMLKTIGISKSEHAGIDCKKLCKMVLHSFPANLLPPAPMVGHRMATDGSLIWDVDLSDAALNAIEIPDAPPDHGTQKSTAPPSFLQELYAGKLLVDGNEDSGYSAAPLHPTELRYLVASAFDMYPAEKSETVSPQSHSQSLLEGEDCDESIYGNGAHYKGCQSKTQKGETCVSWTAMDGHWKQLGSTNHCRNSDGSVGIWCFTTKAGLWGYCEPVGAPNGFTKATNDILVYAKAWMDKSLANFNANHLPEAYEKWMGPSEVARTERVTKQGCSCKKTWGFSGETVTEYCGRPDGDAVDWCFVTSGPTGNACQGADWGYCKDKNDQTKACGPSCQSLRVRLVQAQVSLSQLTFSYKVNPGVYGYVMAASKKTGRVKVHDLQRVQASYKQGSDALLTDTTWSEKVRGRKKMTLCDAWWNEIKDCKDNLGETCTRKQLGTAVGTIVHETLHHVPMSFDDYLYYRNNVADFVKKNKQSEKALRVVRDCADCVEYFLADNNGFTSTGR